MKIILTALVCLNTISCATLEPDYTIFLKEQQSHLKNLKNQECNESGYQIRKQHDGSYRLTVYFDNCDVHQYRLLKEHEKKDWILPDEPKTRLHQ